MMRKIELATFAGVLLLGAHLLDIYLFFPPSSQAAQSLGGFATSIELLMCLVLIGVLVISTILRWILGRGKQPFFQMAFKFLGVVNVVIVAVIFGAIALGYSGQSFNTEIPKRFHSLMNFLSF